MIDRFLSIFDSSFKNRRWLIWLLAITFSIYLLFWLPFVDTTWIYDYFKEGELLGQVKPWIILLQQVATKLILPVCCFLFIICIVFALGCLYVEAYIEKGHESSWVMRLCLHLQERLFTNPMKMGEPPMRYFFSSFWSFAGNLFRLYLVIMMMYCMICQVRLCDYLNVQDTFLSLFNLMVILLGILQIMSTFKTIIYYYTRDEYYTLRKKIDNSEDTQPHE